MKIKKILIVGGNGEIGSQLTKHLSSTYTKYILDKKKNNLNNLNFLKIDLLKKNKSKKIPENIDVIFFLVGIIGGQKSLDIKNFHKYFDYNCKTLLNFLNIVKNQKIKKIIFTSTEHVYGDNHFEKKNNENLEPNPKNYYGVTKLISEKIIQNFCNQRKISLDIFRFPRVISKNNYNIISKIKKVTLMKKNILINKSNINFIYIDDLLNAFVKSMKQKNKEIRIFNIFNNSKSISILSISKIIVKQMKTNSKILLSKKKNIRDHNPKNLKISNSYSKKQLNWNPIYNNIQIVKKIIK